MATNYPETLEYLFSRLPVFQHIGKAAYKADLNNTIALADYLDHPENGFKSIHIAGTNGKGSVSSMLAALFTNHGYKTGLYTSPHLKSFTERIRINGIEIPEEFVVSFTERMKPAIEKINPSFFELTVAMAFEYFRQEKVDIAIIETGMGGRLDSTNIITPELSVITNIGYDHMEFLGDTLAKIAAEKAGIIKPGVPVVIGEWHNETLEVFEIKSDECNSKFYLEEYVPDYWVEALELKGSYQAKNVATFHSAVEALKDLGWRFDEAKILEALRNVKKLTGIRGRWEILGKDPLIIADTGHNEHGLKYVVDQLQSLDHNKLRIVMGVVNDKDLSKILPLFPRDAVYYFAKPAIVRGLDAEILQQKAAEYGLNGTVYNSVPEAFEAAKSEALSDDVIFAGGSTFVVAEVI